MDTLAAGNFNTGVGEIVQDYRIKPLRANLPLLLRARLCGWVPIMDTFALAMKI